MRKCPLERQGHHLVKQMEILYLDHTGAYRENVGGITTLNTTLYYTYIGSDIEAKIKYLEMY